MDFTCVKHYEEIKSEKKKVSWTVVSNCWLFCITTIHFNPLATIKLEASRDAFLLPWKCRIYELISTGVKRKENGAYLLREGVSFNSFSYHFLIKTPHVFKSPVIWHLNLFFFPPDISTCLWLFEFWISSIGFTLNHSCEPLILYYSLFLKYNQFKSYLYAL